MTPGRWDQIATIFRAALDKSAADRASFLDQACAGDDSLRRDVERLLAGQAEPSLDSPVAALLDVPSSDLSPGLLLRHYRIEAKLGEGGMGAVYRAYDTTLHRNVALKILPPDRLSDSSRRQRFLREARAASALNHPNIVTIYEIGSDRGVDFIAMELVEGRRLDDLFRSKPLSPELAARYAAQIAAGLAKAHEAGILHRDLKPANIMVNTEDAIKILDFGLAKRFDTLSGPADSAMMAQLTREGIAIGTAAYMSPEQAQGEPLDARSDIFSFGVILYEMVTGRRPFAANSQLALLSKIVNEDPPPPSEIVSLPSDLEKLILRCLRKDRTRRFQSMADLRVALEDIHTEASSPALSRSALAATTGSPARRLPHRIAFVLGGTVLLASGAWLAARLSPHSPDTAALRTVKFTISPSNLGRGGENEIDTEVSVSRDGKHIAYVESQGGHLWIRDIDQEKARPVPGAASVYQAFWSPDSQTIGYSTGFLCGGAPCNLMSIPVQGGTPALITKLNGSFRRASWSSDGETIVFCDSTGMYTVPSKGGSPTRIIEHPHIEHPSFLDLPGGRRAILYQAVEGKTGHAIYVRLPGESQGRLVTPSRSNNPYPAYSPTGHIIYVDGIGDAASIWAIPFSLKTLQATGKAFPVAQPGSSPVVSATGTLVYSDVPSNKRQLAWVDRSGNTHSTIGEPRRQSSPLLSPDGRYVALEILEDSPDLVVRDLASGVETRLTSDSASESLGAWTPSGDQIAYGSNARGTWDIFSKPPAGAPEPAVLLATPSDEHPLDWSPDQKLLLYWTSNPPTKFDLFFRERRPDGTLGEPVAFLNSPANETAARFSPDGRFVVYASDESGRYEVYVTSFPGHAQKWKISAKGGTAPRWRRDGREILYAQGATLMSVPVTLRPSFSPSAPVPLFERRSLATMPLQYDITKDGKRLLVFNRPASEPPISIHVVHNWFEEFRNR